MSLGPKRLNVLNVLSTGHAVFNRAIGVWKEAIVDLHGAGGMADVERLSISGRSQFTTLSIA
jgi:hypothetical protein